MSSSNASNVSDACDALLKNDTIVSFFPGFAGIPEVIIINLCIWIVFFIIFLSLSYYAWRKSLQGRLHVYEINFVQLMFGDVHRISMSRMSSSSNPVLVPNANLNGSGSQGCCQWFRSMFWMKEGEILERCGPDAELYLSFEFHILVFLGIFSVISCGVILPLDLQGKLINVDYHYFAKTTISNVDPQSKLMFGHVIVSLVIVLICIKIMRHFSKEIIHYQKSELAQRTLILFNLEKEYALTYELAKYFKHFHPDCEIVNIKLIHNVDMLLYKERKLFWAEEAKDYCDYIYETYQKDVLVKSCCWCCCFCCHCKWGNNWSSGSVYYDDNMIKYHHAFINEYEKVRRSVPKLAFVTFQTVEQVETVKKCERRKSKLMPIKFWIVLDSPSPVDIIWEHIASTETMYSCRPFMINATMFMLLFFLTTPTIILSTVKQTGISKILDRIENLNPLLHNFIPAVILKILASTLPCIVSYSCRFLPFHTNSSMYKSIMKRTYLFLLFSVVILPVLGLTSVESFFVWLLKKSKEPFPWQCIFLPDNGAFFVNYVITAGFLGCIAVLFRLSTILWVIWSLLFAKSKAEKINIYKQTFYEVPFGENYASLLLAFTLIIFYSIETPLMAPCGFIYICLMYTADKHSIYFYSIRTKVDASIHDLAVKFVYFSLILMNLGFFGLYSIRAGYNMMSLTLFIIFYVTIVICLYYMKFACCGRIYRSWEKAVYLSIPPKDPDDAFYPLPLQKYKHDLGELE